MKTFTKKITYFIIILSLSLITFLFVASTEAAQDYQMVLKWGSSGAVDGRFMSPRDVTSDALGNVYVVDQNDYQNSVKKFDSSGNFVLQWGSMGSGDGQLWNPMSIAVDNISGNVYVGDGNTSRVHKFDSNGNFITRWGGSGNGNGQFASPQSIEVDAQGNVLVADIIGSIQKFDSNGNFLSKWGSYGTGDNQFIYLQDIAIDSSGNIYTVDQNFPRVQKFDSNFNFINKWGNQGTGDGQFNWPMGIAVDQAGNVYVSDSGNNRVQKFDSNGVFLTKWGSKGSGDGQFDWPLGIVLDSSEDVYIADVLNRRIQKFSRNYLIQNPSFEFDTDTNGIPDNWNPINFITGDGISTDFYKEGKSSLKITGNPLKGKYAKQRIQLSGNAGDTFTLSGWNKTIGASSTGGCIRAFVFLNNTDGTRTSKSFVFNKDTHDWTFGSTNIAAAKNYTSIDIYVGYYIQTGTAYFDDFELLKL